MLKDKAIAYFGSNSEIAKALEISPAAVSKWPSTVPEGSAYKLQVITNAALRVDPTLYPKANSSSRCA